MSQLTKAQIVAALSALNDRLASKAVMGELNIFGGAAMVLAFDARPNTRDVDAIFVPKTEVAEAAEFVGRELNLPEFWLNDGVKGFVSAAPELTEDDLPRFSHLRVLRPTARYLLAMKCLAARVGGYDAPKDREDVLLLCRHLSLNSANAILGIVTEFYPEAQIPVKTRFFVEELAADLQQSEP